MSAIPQALGSSLNEPTSTDPTSAPPMPDQTPGSNPVAQALGTAKKKKGFGPGVKNPGALAGAIARARRARPNALKYGN